jgi:hypothetical protein
MSFDFQEQLSKVIFTFKFVVHAVLCMTQKLDFF